MRWIRAALADRAGRARWRRFARRRSMRRCPPADRLPGRARCRADRARRSAGPRARGGATCRPRCPVSRLSYSGLESYKRCGYRFYLERALRLSARGSESRSRAGGSGTSRRRMPPGGSARRSLRGSLVHQLLEELDFDAPAAPSAERVGELIAAHGEDVRDADVADLTATWWSASRAHPCESAWPRPAGCGPSFRSPSPLEPAGAGGQPPRQRHRRRSRRGGRRRPHRRLQERPPRGPRPRRAHGGGLRDAADRLRARRAALRRRAGRGGLLLPRAPGRAGGGRLRRSAMRRSSSGACSSWPRGSSAGASSLPTRPTATSAPAARAGPRCAAGDPSARRRRREARRPRKPAFSVGWGAVP